MADRTLDAHLSATESITNALDDISRALDKAGISAQGAKESVDEARQSLNQVEVSARSSSEAVDEEAQSFTSLSVAAQAAEEAKSAVVIENEKLAAAAQATDREIDQETRSIMALAAGAGTADEFLSNLAAKGIITADSMDELGDQLDDATISSITATSSLSAFIPVLEMVGESAEDTEDEINHLSQAMGILGGSALATSLNLGPFNFALKNIFTLLPKLIAVVGALATSLLAVGAAAVTAAAGLGMIFGGGLLAVSEQMAANSEDIENRMEAMQEVMSQMGEVFAEAMEPLNNQLSVDMLERFIGGLARALNIVAQAIANMQERMSQFQANVGTAFFSNFNRLVEETGKTLTAMMPYLVAFTDWLVNALANGMAFWRQEAMRFLPVLIETMHTILNFMSAFAELGATVLKGALPVINAVLNLLTGLANVVNALPKGLIAAIAQIAVFIAVVKRLYKYGKQLREALHEVRLGLDDMWERGIKEGRDFQMTLNDILEAEDPMTEAIDKMGKTFGITAQHIDIAEDKLNEFGAAMAALREQPGLAEKFRQNIDIGGDMSAEEMMQEIPNEELNEEFGPTGWGDLAGLFDANPTKEELEETGLVAEDAESSLLDLANVGTLLYSIYGVLSDRLKVVKQLLKGLLPSSVVTGLARVASLLARIASALGLITSGPVLAGILAGAALIAANFAEFMGMIVDLAELALSPFLAIYDSIKIILSAFSGVVDFVMAIVNGIMWAVSLVGELFKLIGSIADVISDVIYGTITGIVTFFVKILELGFAFAELVQYIGGLIWDWTLGLNEVQWVLGGIMDWVYKLYDAFMWVIDGIMWAWDQLLGLIEGGLNLIIDGLNAIISTANLVPGVSIDKMERFEFGGSTKASSSLEGSAEDDMAAGQTTVNNNVTNNEYNFGDFNMLPEEKARVKGLVKQALNEANRNQRLEGGHIS